MKRKTLAAFLGLFALAILVGLSIPVYNTYRHLSVQFTRDMDYDAGTMKMLPNGVRCIQYFCDPFEEVVLDLFFLGDRIETDEHAVFQPELHYDSQYNVEYYRVRDLDNFSALIVKSDDTPTRIVIPCDFGSYCASSPFCTVPREHDAIFAAVMNDIYGCAGSEDIAAVHVEPRPAFDLLENYGADGAAADYSWEAEEIDPVHITDRDTIEAIWNALTESYYFDYSFAIVSAPPSTERLCQAGDETVEYYYSTGGYEDLRSIVYDITLEFHDGSNFRMWHRTSNYNFRFAPFTFGKESELLELFTMEYLYFPPEQRQEIWELLGIEK